MKSKPQHLTVNGNDLARELARLKADGAMVESIDCRVGGKNSAYQINFVESVVELNTERDEKVQGASPLKNALLARMGGERPPCISSRLVGENPTALNPIPEPSISDRIENLKAMAIGAGRMKRDRSIREGRMPYVDH